MPNYSGKKTCSLIHGLSRFFDYWSQKNLAFSPTLGKTLLKRYNLKTCGQKISFFFITCIFLWKNLELVTNRFLRIMKRKLKKKMRKKIMVYSKGLKGAPLNTLKLSFLQNVFNFFSTFIKMLFISIQNFFDKHMQVIKKQINFWPQGLQIVAFQQSFSQCWWKLPILEGSLVKKKTTYLNHELGSKFFFLSSFAHKLVNLLVFEKNSYKMSKDWFFFNYWSGTQLYLWIWSLFQCTLYKEVLLSLLREP